MEASLEFFVGSYFAPGPDPARAQFSSMDTNNNSSHNNNVNHFTVDDLLDFSKEDEEAMTDAFLESLAGNSADESTVTAVYSCNSSVSGGDTTLPFNGNLSCRSSTDVQFSGSELCVPYDDLAELEWLSNFVEESFSSDDMQFIPAAKLPSTTTSAAATDVSSSISSKDCENSPPIFPSDVSVPGKARSKRSRAAPCDWSSRLLLLSPATSSSENTDPTPISPVVNITNNLKRANRRESAETPGRKCLHCASEKTPQWRAGPLGPKTLCNACGVRYKSGRLVPEYRPSASPTFVSWKHSNSHRKVLELRRQKELQRQQVAAKELLSQNSIFCSSDGGGDSLNHHPQQMDGPDFRHMI